MNKKLIAVFWVVFFIFVVFATRDRNQQRDVVSNEPPISKQEQTTLLELHNKERKNAGVEELILDENLCLYAQQHADCMASKHSLFHSSMLRLKRAFRVKYVGENISYGQATQEQAMESWMKSHRHKRNILSSQYKHIGFGFKIDDEGKTYWCVVFTN